MTTTCFMIFEGESDSVLMRVIETGRMSTINEGRRPDPCPHFGRGHQSLEPKYVVDYIRGWLWMLHRIGDVASAG